MRKISILALMVALVWVGVEIHEKGARNAFGGVFSFLAVGDDLPERASEAVSTPKRVGRHVEESLREGAERYRGLVDD